MTPRTSQVESPPDPPSPPAAAAILDPLPLVDAWSCGVERTMRAQVRWAGHCADLGWAAGLFLMRRTAEPVALAVRFGRNPTPDRAVALFGGLVAGTLRDLADETARIAHIACGTVEDAAATLRGEARLAAASRAGPARN